MTTAGDQINGALRLIGVLAEGETPTAAISNDCLSALNQMLDSWSIERLSVYTTRTQTFTWPANTASRTLGPSGNFVGLRPVQLDDSTYFRDVSTGISYNIEFINQSQYDSIGLKTVQSTYPQLIFINTGFPDIEMILFPVPSKALEWNFVSVTELSQPALLTTELAFPSGYLRAFRYNLALEIAPEFGVEPSPQVKRVAMISKRNIKRVNFPGDIMSVPTAMVSNRQRFNIFKGE